MVEPRPSPADTPDDTTPNRSLHYIALVVIVIVIAVIVVVAR